MSNNEWGLLPCPFCGGDRYEIRENGKQWLGGSYSNPVSISILHWCNVDGQPRRVIERVGKDYKSAIAMWNMRANSVGNPTGRAE